MTFARELAGFHGVRIRVEAHLWELTDGAVKWEYVASRTGQKLWSRLSGSPERGLP